MNINGELIYGNGERYFLRTFATATGERHGYVMLETRRKVINGPVNGRPSKTRSKAEFG